MPRGITGNISGNIRGKNRLLLKSARDKIKQAIDEYRQFIDEYHPDEMDYDPEDQASVKKALDISEKEYNHIEEIHVRVHEIRSRLWYLDGKSRIGKLKFESLFDFRELKKKIPKVSRDALGKRGVLALNVAEAVRELTGNSGISAFWFCHLANTKGQQAVVDPPLTWGEVFCYLSQKAVVDPKTVPFWKPNLAKEVYEKLSGLLEDKELDPPLTWGEVFCDLSQKAVVDPKKLPFWEPNLAKEVYEKLSGLLEDKELDPPLTWGEVFCDLSQKAVVDTKKLPFWEDNLAKEVYEKLNKLLKDEEGIIRLKLKKLDPPLTWGEVFYYLYCSLHEKLADDNDKTLKNEIDRLLYPPGCRYCWVCDNPFTVSKYHPYKSTCKKCKDIKKTAKLRRKNKREQSEKLQ